MILRASLDQARAVSALVDTIAQPREALPGLTVYVMPDAIALREFVRACEDWKPPVVATPGQ